MRWHALAGLPATLFHLNHGSVLRVEITEQALSAKNRELAYRTDEIAIEELEAHAAELRKYFVA